MPLTDLALGLAGCGEKGGQQNTATKSSASSAGASQAGVTPMPQRVAVLGVLNKRNGIVRDVALHPGQSAKWKDLSIHLRACEATAPWEEEKLTGAFVQVDVQQPNGTPQRVFSGWLYKESPSLNVVEHPVYDVWPKSCEMTYPAGPAAPAAPVTSSSRSSAAKSGGAARSTPTPATTEPAPAPATAPPAPSAAESNAT
jgi:hypothetical protein